MPGKAMEPAPDLVQQASAHQARQDDPGVLGWRQTAGTQQPFWRSRLRTRYSGGVGEHGYEHVPFIRQVHNFDEKLEPMLVAHVC